MTIGLAVLSGVLLLVLLVVLYLFYKMWSTHKNAIKKDLYGVDYEGDEVGRSLSVSFLDFLRNLPAKLERRLRIRKTLAQTAWTSSKPKSAISGKHEQFKTHSKLQNLLLAVLCQYISSSYSKTYTLTTICPSLFVLVNIVKPDL